MRISLSDVFRIWKAQFGEQSDGTCLCFLLGKLAMQDRGLGDLFHDLLGWIKGGSSRLRHIRHFGTAQAPDVAQTGLKYVATVHFNGTAGDFDTAAAVCHRRQTNRGFACTGFSDEAKNLSLGQIKVNAVHDFDLVGFLAWGIHRGSDFKAADFQQLIGHPRPPFRLVVRFRTQSATRFTEMARTAIVIAGQSAAPIP